MKAILSTAVGFSLLVLGSYAPGAEIEVRDGDSIQKAVTGAEPGDSILVHPGTYAETVYIDKDNITLRGIVTAGQWPVLEGGKVLNDAVLYSGNGITIESLRIQNYKGNGIMGQAGNNFAIRNNWIVDAGVYAIFPEFGKNGIIEHNVMSGIEDAAIYVGMSDNVDVLHNEVFDSVAGIEIENTRHALVEGNYVHDNTGGILAFITPGLPIKTAFDVIIRKNFVINNNHENFGVPGSIVSYVPQGTGIIVMAADDVVIEDNIITGNDFIGIGIVGLEFISGVRSDPESEPNPDRMAILGNMMWGNGSKAPPDIMAAIQAVRPDARWVDIADLSKGTGSCITDKYRYPAVGLDRYTRCSIVTTADTLTYTLPQPVEGRVIAAEEKGKAAYYGICAGCHAYSVQAVGPPAIALQAIYQGRPQALADYIAQPVKKRSDMPEMPPQAYLSEEVRLAVAEFMLAIDR